MIGDPAARIVRPSSAKARIIEYLNAGWTDLEAMWKALERDHPHLHLSWSYICKVHRAWKAKP